MAALWLNQYHPRNKTRPWFAIASRGNRNSPRTVLQSTATKIVIKLMNWNQYRVGTLLHRVHTDCLGRKFSPQRSQYTRCSPTGRDSNQRSPSAYCVCRSKNYWSEGQFWSRSLFLHKSLICPRGAERCVPLVSGPSTQATKAFTGTRTPAPPLCDPRLAVRPAVFADPLCASPNLSTGRSCH